MRTNIPGYTVKITDHSAPAMSRNTGPAIPKVHWSGWARANPEADRRETNCSPLSTSGLRRKCQRPVLLAEKGSTSKTTTDARAVPCGAVRHLPGTHGPATDECKRRHRSGMQHPQIPPSADCSLDGTVCTALGMLLRNQANHMLKAKKSFNIYDVPLWNFRAKDSLGATARPGTLVASRLLPFCCPA